MSKEKSFIELSKKYESLKEEMKTIKSELQNLMLELGEGTMFQDEEDGTVFKIVKPTGTFVEFQPINYERTKRAGEAKGSLSLKKAEEAGFTLKK